MLQIKNTHPLLLKIDRQMTSGMRALSRKHPSNFTLGALVSVPTMAMTLIAPAVPAVRAEFSTSYNEAQLIITAYLGAMAAGLLFVGMLSDRYGRRPVFTSGLLLFFLASLLGYFAPDSLTLVIARSIQGLSGAALMTTGRVIANDIHDIKNAPRALATITAIQAIVPIISLAVGGLIVDLFGWRATMGVMTIVSGAVGVQSLIRISETNHNRLSHLSFQDFIKAFQTVLSSRKWQLYSICAGMQIGMFYSMNGYMSYHFTRLGSSLSEFGFYYATISFGYLIGNVVTRQFNTKVSLGQWVILGSWITLITIMIIWGFNEMSWLSPPVLSFLLCVVGFSHGLLIANALIGSLQGMGPHSGSAGGIGSVFHMVFGAIAGSLIIGLGGATDFWIGMVINAAMALCSIWAAKKAIIYA